MNEEGRACALYMPCSNSQETVRLYPLAANLPHGRLQDTGAAASYTLTAVAPLASILRLSSLSDKLIQGLPYRGGVSERFTFDDLAGIVLRRSSYWHGCFQP
jgi:hypothetical protein